MFLFKESLNNKPFESSFLILNNLNKWLINTHQFNSYKKTGFGGILEDFNLENYLYIRFGVALNLSAQNFTQTNLNNKL